MCRAVLFFVVLAVVPCGVITAQTFIGDISSLALADREARNTIPLPFSTLVPKGIRLGYDMRAYIASPEFGAFDSIASPEETFDEIYFEALAMAHGDLHDALLAASFGAFEHEFIPLTFFGAEVDVPLTSEDPARFRLRVSHLPEHLYHTPEGDKDKIQHFYASAWLKSIFGMDWLVHLAGEAVEEGETLFVIGDSRDPRDVHANADGVRFELQAERQQEALPSKSLTPNP